MRGFSLLEVMISLTLAMLLLLAAAKMGVFIGQLWLQQEKSMNHIEALNVTYSWIARDIESAGYFGCLKQSVRQGWDDPLHLLMEHEIEFSNSTMAVQYMSPEASSLESKVSPYEWVVNNTLLFKEGDEVVFEDCINLAINRVVSVNHQGDDLLLVLEAPFMANFSIGTKVGYLRRHDYQIKATSRKTAQGEPITSLYVLDNHQWQEVLESVRAMTWYQSGAKISTQLTMMDGFLLTMQADQKNAV